MEYKVIISGLEFPEGPVFDFAGNLWFVEIKGGNLSRWDGENLLRIDVKGTPNGAAVDKSGNIWFCDSARGEIRKYNPAAQTFQTLCTSITNGESLKRPNDLIFDSEGNLLFSDHADGREKPLSTICVLPKGENKARVISSKKYFTNGLALKANTQTLIFAETYHQQLWSGTWDSKKLMFQNERPFAKAGKGPWGPDGIAFDKEENLYVAIFNESKINIYNPEGQITEEISCPDNRPTSCSFDPSGKLGLVVTGAEQGLILSYKTEKTGLPLYY